jgi:uncharacterized protein (DUF2384 family)
MTRLSKIRLKGIPRALFLRAVEVLESEAAAVEWFKSPVGALGGLSPRNFVKLHGTAEVKRILGRIEHGVFS